MIRARCPDPHDWQAFLEGKGGDTPPGLAGHLESCPDCRKELEALAADAAEWHDAALALGQRRTGPDSTLRRVMEQLKGEPPAVEEEELSFLQPAEKPGLLGMLGPYEVQEVIGRGSMGLVLKAYEPALNRFVAIKVMAAALAGNATARLRFKREAQSAAAVCHDHVVAVHGVHEVEGLPYLVMQYVAGESLQERLQRAGPLEVEEAVRIGMQTASGLTAAHAQGLIHRDIKPANLLLENGVARVKITDFGLARTADDAGLTRDGVVAGTPEYMAPEQARGEPVDYRADLFSLGGALYACCTGRPPFRASTALAVLKRVCEEEPASIRSLNPAVPAWLEALVNRLMAKDPANRFPGAAEVTAVLEQGLAHLRQPETVPAPPLAKPGGGRSFLLRRPSLWVALVLLGLLGLGAGLIALGTAGTDRQALLRDDATVPVRRLRRHTGPVHNLRFTPDGRLVSGSGWPSGDHCLRVWDPTTGQELRHIPTPGQVQGLDVSADGRFALAGLDNGRVLYLELDTGRVLQTLQGHSGPVGWAGFAPDGKHGFSTSHDGTARLWDLDKGTEVRRYRVDGKWANYGAVFPDGRRLLTGDDRGLLQVWDVATGQELKRIEAGNVLWLLVLPDNRHALVSAGDPSLWDLDTGEQVRVFRGNEGEVKQAALSPDGRRLATASFGGKVQLWDFQTGELLRVLGSHDEWVLSVAFSSDGRLVASGGGGRHEGDQYLPGTDHDIRVWDLSGTPADQAAPPRSGNRPWLAAGSIVGLVIATTLALLGVWLLARRRRASRGRAAAQAGPPAAGTLIPFACPACGHNLKVKAELAGKKGKCPKCGELVLVPGPAVAGQPGGPSA